VIDNLERTDALIEKMRAALPMDAGLGIELKSHLMEQCPEATETGQCTITDIIYSGDMGGIVCYLDLGIPDSEKAYIVSITHLAFGRGNPLSREIAAYQRRRVKRLRKQHACAF
jgi:hypothetical protein